MSPELRLCFHILAQAFRRRPQPNVRIQEVTGEFGKTHRRIALNTEITILELRVRPGQFESAARDIGIAVFVDQTHQVLTRPRSQCDQRDLHLLPRFKRNALSHHEHRIQHVAIGLVQRH